MLASLKSYLDLISWLDTLTEKGRKATLRDLCRTDLFFLIFYGLGRRDIAKPWLLERCRDVQNDPDEYLDLWAREHYKSTIITFGKTIQDILASHGDDPLPCWEGREVTVGIFSITRPIAKGFLRQIKQELAANETLKWLFPDILYQDPDKEATKWSEDDGLIVKRKGNPKESTVEAWGIIDGQPTSKHFLICLYDDLVTEKSVTTPEMIEKTNRQWELSINLGTEGGKRRYVGTRYHFNDSYRLMIDRKIVKLRIFPATVDGTADGVPVLKSKKEIVMKRQAMGVYTFSTQMLLNPVADSLMGFKRDWVRYHTGSDGAGMNIYIIVDPANAKKKTSDYTAYEVIGLAADQNYYTLEKTRDRLSLTQRTDELFRLHRKWRPLAVGYEQYGMQADTQHIQDKQNRENYRFEIIELGGNMPKTDRIKRLIPVFEQKRWYLPQSCFKTNYEGHVQDLVDIFLNQEYDAFPVPVHDDMLDCMARILDEKLGALFPKSRPPDDDAYASGSSYRGSAWSA